MTYSYHITLCINGETHHDAGLIVADNAVEANKKLFEYHESAWAEEWTIRLVDDYSVIPLPRKVVNEIECDEFRSYDR